MNEWKLVIVIVRSIHSHRHISFHHDTEACHQVYTSTCTYITVRGEHEVSVPPTIDDTIGIESLW